MEKKIRLMTLVLKFILINQLLQKSVPLSSWKWNPGRGQCFIFSRTDWNPNVSRSFPNPHKVTRNKGWQETLAWDYWKRQLSSSQMGLSPLLPPFGKKLHINTLWDSANLLFWQKLTDSSRSLTQLSVWAWELLCWNSVADSECSQGEHLL